MELQDYKRTYVWELPVRVFHWANAVAIVALIITGYLIAHPPAIWSNQEASQQFWFGTIRKVHFMSAYIFAAVMFLRIYWAFKGNEFARLKVFINFSAEARKKMWDVVKYEIFLQRKLTPDEPHLGHNNVAAFSYLVMFVLALVMMFTGFGLYADTATWFFPRMFAWVPEFLGGDYTTRVLHHICMWTFVLFVVVHVYLVLFHDWLEGTGESSSMISGYKFDKSSKFKTRSTSKKVSA